jgi:hypothetical protein
MDMNEQIQQELLQQQMDSQDSNFEEMRQNYLRNPSPDNNYESAVYLLSNSDTFLSIPEIEKEIKLGNLSADETIQIQSLVNSYQDLILINDLQIQKFKQTLNTKDFNKFQKEQNLAKLDKLNFLRRAVSISSTSRGRGGFERNSQNTVINKSFSDMNSTQQPSMRDKMFGSFGGNQ